MRKFVHLDMVHSSTETERSIKELRFPNRFEFYVEWNFLEVAILVPKVCSSRLYAWEVIGSFKDKIYTIGYAPRLN